MFALVNWRLVAALILLALLTASHYTVYRKGKHVVQLEWQAATASANTDARRLEQARQSAADAAGRLAAAREAGIRADADRARGAAGGLRDDLSLVQRASTQSLTTADNAVRALADVVGRCTGEYQRVAEEADRATSEVKTLRDAWPR